VDFKPVLIGFGEDRGVEFSLAINLPFGEFTAVRIHSRRFSVVVANDDSCFS
jgi:hypothetical protein